jgi:MoaA/NifB/PqqE/SkfB family radical SAM enzyme
MRPNQFRHASVVTNPGEYREGRWRTFEPRAPIERVLGGKPALLRPGLTFTPYANPTPCNAHCAFCSEELLRLDATRLSAKTPIGDRPSYFAALDAALTELAGFEMGLSLSGLEATSDPEWLLQLLALVKRHDALFPERVLYTNGSGLHADARLIPALVDARFTRIELSRCHFDEQVNHRVMRFERDVEIRARGAFEETVRRVLAAGLDLKLVCILNRQAVATLDDVERYLDDASALGVQRVVFRSLSELGTLYRENRETRWIAQQRVSVRELMDQVLPEGGVACAGWTFEGVTSGYYYYNEVYRRGGVEVVLEGASYVAHHDEVQAGVVQKLVFHSTGELCGDWVPNAQVLAKYDGAPRARHVRLLKSLAETKLPFVTYGTAGLLLLHPELELPLKDSDILLPPEVLLPFVQWAQSRGAQVTSWSEPWNAQWTAADVAGRFYIRATFGDLQLDATYEEPDFSIPTLIREATWHEGVPVCPEGPLLAMKERKRVRRD